MINERDYLLDVNDTLRSEIVAYKIIGKAYKDNETRWLQIEDNYKNVIEGMKVPWYDHFWLGAVTTTVIGVLMIIFLPR